MSMEYIRSTYKVPAKRGGRVEYTHPEPTRMGTITGTRGARGKRRPPRVGETLQLYTGLRTSACRKLLYPDPVCIAAIPITISVPRRAVSWPRQQIDSETWWPLDEDEIAALARADGFNGPDEFFQFFGQMYGKTLSGYLIKW